MTAKKKLNYKEATEEGGFGFSILKGGDFSAGDVIIDGLKYVEKKTGIGRYNSTVYVFEDTEAKEGNKLVGFFGNAVLNGKMTEVSLGNFVQITHAGLKKGENGSYPTYTVLFAEG